MKAKVDPKRCSGCGICENDCPEVFELNDEGKSHIIDPKGCSKCDCQKALDSCPVDAISLK